MNRSDKESQTSSTNISHRVYSSRDEIDEIETESLLNEPNNNNNISSRTPTNIQRYFFNALDNKSIWSIISTFIYLCCHRKRKYNKCKIIMCIIILLICLIYMITSLYLDIPYWINHGYHYHFDHFKWSSTLNGTYCDLSNNELNFKKKPFLNKISINNTDFSLTRSRVLLLSYPRSGNHLTKAMIECLLEIPTFGYEKEKKDGKQQEIAIKTADINKPYIRKIHSPNHITQEFAKYNHWGLIYLIRDPMECILSENKYVPYFWKDYEYQFGESFMLLPRFYNKWKSDQSKLIIFYEDYFNGTHGINLRKLGKYFGENRVSNERIDFCIKHYNEVTQHGLKSLDRGATSNTNLHFYREKYYGKNNNDLILKVPQELYNNVLKRYENIQTC